MIETWTDAFATAREFRKEELKFLKNIFPQKTSFWILFFKIEYFRD